MEFRNKFVAILAEQIARYFYPHDRHDDYGQRRLERRGKSGISSLHVPALRKQCRLTTPGRASTM